MKPIVAISASVAWLLLAGDVWAQVDQKRAAEYLEEAGVLCRQENGRLWGQSLCGPIVISDAPSKTSATNQAPPDAPKPATLGYANAAMQWGSDRWTTLVWQIIPADPHLRAKLLLHELFHRIQPSLGLLGDDGHNEHLDTLDGRYLIRMEWRALAKALQSEGAGRIAALSDALAFRRERRRRFPGSAENERRLEMNEGLAQYTATRAASASAREAEEDAAYQLLNVSENATFVRTFPYAAGAAYGLLLDAYLPDWRKSIKATNDLTEMAGTAAKASDSGDVSAIAAHYGGPELRLFEERREAERKERVTELRRRFVDGPVLVLPASRSSAFTTNGMVPIPGVGTVFPNFRGGGDWGSVEAASILVADERKSLVLPASGLNPASPAGEGWKLTVAPGWKVTPGARAGDYELVVAK